MGKKILSRGASVLAALALAFGVLVGFQLPANAASCTSGVSGQPVVKLGSRGKAAKAVQCLLRRHGYSISTDGSINTSDITKIKRFQRSKGIAATGRVANLTWGALKKSPSKQKATKKRSSSSKTSSSQKGRIALDFAKAQLGERYRFAGAGPNVWDCSGLTMKAWAKAGVRLPHHSGNQMKVGKRVSRSNLQLGDLVYFYSGRSHVGIYAGNNRVIHAPNPRKRVEYSPIKYMPYAGASRPAG